MKGAPAAVGGAVDTLLGFLFAVPVLQVLPEYPESDGRLGSGPGFGDHIDRHPFPLAEGEELAQLAGTHIVAGKIDLGGILGKAVVQRGAQKLNHRPRPQVGAANADDDKQVAVPPDFLGSHLDAAKLIPVILRRQIQPPEKIIPPAGALAERLVGRHRLGGDCVKISGLRKPFRYCSFSLVAIELPPRFALSIV